MIIYFFVKHRNTPFIRSSNITLSFLQLLPHVIIMLVPVLHFGQISKLQCHFAIIIPGVCMTLIMSIIFVKTIFLRKVFRRKTVATNVIRIKIIHYAGIGFIAFLHLCSNLVILISSKTGTLTESCDRETMTCFVSCESPLMVLCQIIFVLILSLACMIEAFKARTLPYFFNETKLICYASSLIILLCTMCPMLYFSYNGMHGKLLVLQTTIFILNMWILICWYCSKISIIVLYPHKNTNVILKVKLFENMKRDVEEKLSRLEYTACSSAL